MPSRRVAALFLVAVTATGVVLPGVAASAAPAAVHDVNLKEYRVYHQEPGGYVRYEFSSPSGNLRCEVAQYEDSAPWGCFARSHTWKDPKLPAEYSETCSKGGGTRLAGGMFANAPGGDFVERCAGTDPAATHRGKVLPVGSRIRVHGVTCTSTSAGGQDVMRCSAGRTRLTIGRTVMRFSDSTH